LLEDRRSRIGREDVGPEFSAGKSAADAHHEIDGLAPLLFSFPGEGEDDVEGWTDTGFKTAGRALVNRFEILPLLVYGLKNFARTGFNALANLLQTSAVQET